MKKNRFKHCLLMLLMLAFSSSVAAQNQQLTAKQLSEKADEALEKEDYKEALKWIRMAAEKGDLSSQELLSTLLENGDEEFGVEKNEGEALMWLTKAAEAGSASAQMTLARKYEKGKMVAQSYEEAIRWYEKAAKKNEYAIVCLKEIYEKLGSQSDAAGLYNLGKLYHAENAYQEAAKWYRMAAEKGDTDAMNRLGLLHANEKEYTEAVKWYRMAAEKGNASAMYNLALNYEKGNGVAKDGQEAAKWYRMAAEKGDTDAMDRLGLLHEYKKEYTEAVKWYRMAAEKGNASAMYSMGEMYAKGNGVAKDGQEAAKWYRMAAEKGNAQQRSAEEKRKKIDENITIIQGYINKIRDGIVKLEARKDDGYLLKDTEKNVIDFKEKEKEVIAKFDILNKSIQNNKAEEIDQQLSSSNQLVSESAQLVSAISKQRSAEAKQRSAEAKQRSAEALTSSLKNLVWFFNRYHMKDKEAIPPNETQEWKNKGKEVFTRCKDINLNYKAILSKELGDDEKVKEVLKFYGVE